MFCSTDCMDYFHSKSIKWDLNFYENDMNVLTKVSAAFNGYKELDNFIQKTDLK
jgi:hypothetical protein